MHSNNNDEFGDDDDNDDDDVHVHVDCECIRDGFFIRIPLILNVMLKIFHSFFDYKHVYVSHTHLT